MIQVRINGIGYDDIPVNEEIKLERRDGLLRLRLFYELELDSSLIAPLRNPRTDTICLEIYKDGVCVFRNPYVACYGASAGAKLSLNMESRVMFALESNFGEGNLEGVAKLLMPIMLQHLGE